RFLSSNTYLFALAVMLIALAINYNLQPNLFESRPLGGNFRAFLPLMLVAAGQTIVILGGGIDLSVGAIITLTNAIIATRILEDASQVQIMNGMLYACLIGMAAGAFNGLCVAYLRLQPI